MKIKLTFSIFLLIITQTLIAQQSTIEGVVKDNIGKPITEVAISYENTGTTSDKKGKYSILISSNKKIKVTFTHVAFNTLTKTFDVPKGKTLHFSPRLKPKTEEIEEVIVKDRGKDATGIVTVDINKIKKIPGGNSGVENILMTFAGVNNNNELSTQYNVRGGNFDENLVYVNGIEVYRPFLVRSGQQEGLSFVNVDMTQNVNFSAGGFQAKYGDKLSSVLDITYRTPTKFATTVGLSLLGGNATVEGKLFKDKVAAIIGIRHRNNSLLVNSKDIDINYNPKFSDVQTFLSYAITKKFKLDFLGNFSLNNYNYTPISRRTDFGTATDPLELNVYYEGQEKDRYATLFGAFKGIYQVNDNLQMSLTTSAYNAQEAEHYDISATYSLGEKDTNAADDNFGNAEFLQGIGSQLNHARNDLDALISNINLQTTYKKGANSINFGLKYQKEDIRNRLIEWEVIDSLGFSVRPPNLQTNNQPYEPFEGEIVPFQNVRANNNVQINRLSTFIQWSKRSTLNEHKIWYNIGVRAQNWSVSGTDISNTKSQTIISPRAQFAIKPNWDKDMLFRFSTGFYYQPPFYKELRNQNGTVNPNVKAQKSIHFVLGNDYSFELWERPFKLVTEVYYKQLSDVNPYTVDNVRIRYAAENNAIAYTTGFDVRMNGEFVPGTESWISMGILSTKENIDNQGYIPRPTDQRFKMAILFQDYVPNIPNLKMYLNLVYNSGVPGGSPSYANRYDYQDRLKPYKRADLGISYVIVDQNRQSNSKLFKNFKEFAVGFELYNMFDVTNSITNTWVRNVYSKRSYGVPNYMTRRVLNIKLDMKF